MITSYFNKYSSTNVDNVAELFTQDMNFKAESLRFFKEIVAVHGTQVADESIKKLSEVLGVEWYNQIIFDIFKEKSNIEPYPRIIRFTCEDRAKSNFSNPVPGARYNKIGLIKMFRKHTGAGLVESKTAIETLERYMDGYYNSNTGEELYTLKPGKTDKDYIIISRAMFVEIPFGKSISDKNYSFNDTVEEFAQYGGIVV
jgi:ribosomal protein L7/L12